MSIEKILEAETENSVGGKFSFDKTLSEFLELLLFSLENIWMLELDLFLPL